MIKKLVALIAVIFLGGIIYFSPSIDQTIAILPYAKLSNTFYGEGSYWVECIYFLVPYVTFLLIAVPLFIMCVPKYKKYRRAMLISLLSLALGPGLIVNTLFKNHWGRPRPYQVIRDHEAFSPMWQPHFTSPKDNSFCSGHAAIGFFLGVPFWALRRKKIALVTSIAGGGIIGLVRVLQGGHYVSDIIFAGVFVWVVTYLVIYSVDSFVYMNTKNGYVK